MDFQWMPLLIKGLEDLRDQLRPSPRQPEASFEECFGALGLRGNLGRRKGLFWNSWLEPGNIRDGQMRVPLIQLEPWAGPEP